MKSTSIIVGAAAVAAHSPLSMSVDGNLRTGAWNNLQAKWSGDHEGFGLSAEYDRSKHSGFLHKFGVSRNVVQQDNLSVDAELTHNFADNSDTLKVAAKTGDVDLSATYCAGDVSVEAAANFQGVNMRTEYSDGNVEVEASRAFNVGGRDLSFNPKYNVNSKLLASKLRYNVDDDSSLGADVDFNTGDHSVGYQFQYNRNLGGGDNLEVALKPGDNDLNVQWTSSSLEDGAKWTVDAGFDYSKGTNMFADSSVSMKRSWDW